nr:hypothetical protein [Tanacetum cinerariifolium]
VLLDCDYTQDVKFDFVPDILCNFNFTKDPYKVPNIELTDHMIDVNNQKDSVSPLPFSGKKKKVKSQTMTPTLAESQGPKASEFIPVKEEKAPVQKERNIQLAGTRLPSSIDEGVCKSEPLLEGTTTDPKDSGGNVQPADKGLPFATSHKGTAKTTSRPEGPLGDKELEGNKPPADMDEYQVDETQSTREIDEEEVFAAGDDMEEETQTDEEEHQSPSPNKDKPEPSHSSATQESDFDSSSADHKKIDNILPLIERQLIKYLRKASVEGYYEENIVHRYQTGKLVEASMSSFDKSRIETSDLYKGLNIITELLKDIKNAVKDYPVLNKKVIEATEAYTKNSSALTELLNLVKNFDFHGLKSSNLGPRMTIIESSQAAIKSDISTLRQDTSEIKSMMLEIYWAFKGQASTLSSSVSLMTLDDKTKEEPTREVALIESSSKPPLTDLIIEIHVPQRERKAIATDDQLDVQIKLVLAPKEVHVRVTELDKLGPIIQKKKNTIVKDLMTSLGKRYERLNKIPEELGIQSTLYAPVLEQDPSESSGRKRKHMELEPKIKVPG